MGYLSRKPTSNDLPRQTPGKSKYLEENEFVDEIALLLGGYAKRCSRCRKAVRTKHLDAEGNCPDCR